MIKTVFGIIVLVATVAMCAWLYWWVIATQTFDGWFYMGLVLAGVTFLLASGIIMGALLLERSRSRH